jgi:DNA-binding beta-propeller fold protein YncE
VGKNPQSISPDGTDVWVANFDDATVTELDASDGSIVQTIPCEGVPDGISSDGTHVWTSNLGSGVICSDGTVTELAT